jgi:hypothetical protein
LLTGCLHATGRWYLRISAAPAAVQAEWDYWHDLDTGEPILERAPWNQPDPATPQSMTAYLVNWLMLGAD